MDFIAADHGDRRARASLLEDAHARDRCSNMQHRADRQRLTGAPRRSAAPPPKRHSPPLRSQSGRSPRRRSPQRPRSRMRADGRSRDRRRHRGRRRSRSAAASPSRAAPAKSFEERFGTSWVVWVGGLALALGGIFLVQYSIEAGLIGPGVRIFLGGLLAAALVAAGEWTRRSEIVRHSPACRPRTSRASSPPPAPRSPIATIYAAYALYGFLVPGTAFVLLGIVALATLAAALLHGPALAALGQVGAFVAPLLVATRHAELLGALHLSRGRHRRLVRARARAAVALACDHGGRVRRALDVPRPRRYARQDSAPHAFHAVVGFALAAALLVSGLFYGPDAEAGRDRSGLVRRARRLSVRRRRAGARVRARRHRAHASSRCSSSRPSRSRGAPRPPSPPCRSPARSRAS